MNTFLNIIIIMIILIIIIIIGSSIVVIITFGLNYVRYRAKCYISV